LKYFIIFFLLVLFCISFGCKGGGIAASNTNSHLLGLEMGMTKEQVITAMGEEPDLNEAYQNLNGKSVVIYFYQTVQGKTTKVNCTPLVFEEGKLVGWGDEFYKYKMEVDINVKTEDASEK
jgi:hypothetical protein